MSAALLLDWKSGFRKQNAFYVACIWAVCNMDLPFVKAVSAQNGFLIKQMQMIEINKDKGRF